jgi:hypothetical protein
MQQESHVKATVSAELVPYSPTKNPTAVLPKPSHDGITVRLEECGAELI